MVHCKDHQDLDQGRGSENGEEDYKLKSYSWWKGRAWHLTEVREKMRGIGGNQGWDRGGPSL